MRLPAAGWRGCCRGCCSCSSGFPYRRSRPCSRCAARLLALCLSARAALHSALYVAVRTSCLNAAAHRLGHRDIGSKLQLDHVSHVNGPYSYTVQGSGSAGHENMWGVLLELGHHSNAPVQRLWSAMCCGFADSARLQLMDQVRCAQGVATQIYAAFSPELGGHSGAYLEHCCVAQPSKTGRDPEQVGHSLLRF